MRSKLIVLGIIGLIIAATLVYSLWNSTESLISAASEQNARATSTAILAGGCFWCVEADFEKLEGVIDVVSGYAGGDTQGPAYADYAEGGHREVVEVTYDPARVSFAGLVEYLIKHSDPTDSIGSFGDRGVEYSSAIYYGSIAEKNAAEEVIRKIDAMNIYEKPLAIVLISSQKFWPAEDYHQDYYKKNPIRYNFYRTASGRDAFVSKHWGNSPGITLSRVPTSQDGPWTLYVKPADAELRTRLSTIQYDVTQKEGTERAFANEYWDNEKEGIYVDLLSGEPLFSSEDKYDSGTGWPSFTKPLEPDNIVLREDRSFFGVRTEVRSKYGDSHLGHLFNDGPPQKGGLRYCMNSAALRFVPKENLEREGYGMYANFFE